MAAITEFLFLLIAMSLMLSFPNSAMAKTSILLLSWLLMAACSISVSMAHTSRKNSTKTSSYAKKIPSYPRQATKLMNTIDSCWRSNANWDTNRKALADCAIGFGRNAIGGKNGAIYMVTDPSDDCINPKSGTLRYGVIQTQPLWIIFAKDMVITLENELLVNSYKTIDGRGAKIEITKGPCITIEGVSNVIIHGLSIHDCKPGKPGMVRSTPTHVGHRLGCDGDAVTILASKNVWVDHNYLARCADGLVDVTHASNAVTISNNYLTQHDKVILLGHNDAFTADKNMKVTVVYNHFGPQLVQRLPRVRHGYAHVANNMYDQWLMYAIGGSANPTILSEGNYFAASNDPRAKQVTKREEEPAGWKNWKWRSTKDVFLNGAYFLPSGYGSCAPNYLKAQSFVAAPGNLVPLLTADAGPLQCVLKKKC